MAGAAKVWGDGVVHPMDILLLQVGCIRVAGGQGWGTRPGGFLTVTSRGKSWRKRAWRREKWETERESDKRDWRVSPQRQGSRLIRRKVNDVRVPLLVSVRCVGEAEDCGSSEGTVSNLRGVILRRERRVCRNIFKRFKTHRTQFVNKNKYLH